MKVKCTGLLTLLAGLASCASVTKAELEDSRANYVKLGFDKLKGNTFSDATKHAKPIAKLHKRDDGYEEMTIVNQQSFYSVELGVGSSDQNVTVLVDTGSSDLWIMGSNNPYCKAGTVSNNKRRVGIRHPEKRAEDFDPFSWLTFSSSEGSTATGTQTIVPSASATLTCSQYGTFATSSSSSFQSNDTEFYIQYGDGTFALGTWGTDTIKVDGLEISNVSFAVANETDSSVGVLGIGLPGLETTNSGSLVTSARDAYEYENFPLVLKRDGIINRNAYSLFLNSSDAQTGSVLFGAVDHSKYTGTLYTIPLINTLSGYSEPIQFEVTLQGLGLQANDTNTTLTTTKIPALLDSGTTLAYFPSNLATMIARGVGATYSSLYGYYMMSCSDIDTSTEIIYDFGGFLIASPLENYIIQTSGSTCILGILPQSGNSIILGDTFLTSAYVVYDLENLEISLAQANVGSTGSDNIDVISSSVPSAVKAPAYSSTWSTSASIATGGNIFTVTVGSSQNNSSGTTTTSGSSGTTTRSTSTTTSSTRQNLAIAIQPSWQFVWTGLCMSTVVSIISWFL